MPKCVDGSYWTAEQNNWMVTDDLKKVNDTLGHEMGDIMILNFAKLLRKVVPPPTCCTRQI